MRSTRAMPSSFAAVITAIFCSVLVATCTPTVPPSASSLATTANPAATPQTATPSGTPTETTVATSAEAATPEPGCIRDVPAAGRGIVDLAPEGWQLVVGGFEVAGFPKTEWQV